MTLFEYLAAGYVLIFSFAVLRAVSGVPYALRPSSRYWVHVVYLAIVLANLLVAFWAFWFYRDVEWTFYGFVATLAIPVLFYVYASLLVPPDPSSVPSWHDHFFEVRIPLFIAGLGAFTSIAISHQSVLGVPALHSAEWPVYATIAIHAIGLTSMRPNLHALLAFAFACLTVVVIVGVLAQTDPLVPLIP